MNLLATLKRILRPAPVDPEAVLEARRLTEEQETIRLSQYGRLPYANLPPTPDLPDRGRDRR